MRLTQSLQARLFLGASAWSGVALIITWLFLSYLVRGQLEAQVHHRLEIDMGQLLAHVSDHTDGQIKPVKELSDPLYQRVYSGHYWQIRVDNSVIARSRSLWDQDLATEPVSKTGSGSYRHIAGPRGEPLLTLTRWVTLPRIPSDVQLEVTTSLQEIESAVSQFRLVLAFGLGALALGLLVAVMIQVRLGLRPLVRMRAGLADIRNSRAQSLQGQYPDEVRPLVDDLNAVLADNDTLVERARSRAGNLAHALKTPLSILANEADNQTRRGDSVLGQRLLREIETMRARIDWHLAHARIAARLRPGTRTAVEPVLGRLQRTLRRLYREREISVQTEANSSFLGEVQDLEQMLGNLMDNACKWAAHQVQVRVAKSGSQLFIQVNDDGPGLTPQAREEAISRGSRLDETTPGDGLGLSIVRELAELYGGRLELGDASIGGLAARLFLPAI